MLHETIRAGSGKARIWQICDELASRNGAIPSGREVVDIYMSEGGHEGTGFTQYSHWKKAFLSQEEGGDENADVDNHPRSVGSIAFRPITISPEGYLVLPKDVRRAMLLDSDGRATVCVVDGELRIISPLGALHQLQQRARSLSKADRLVSDELIAERRAEAQSE